MSDARAQFTASVVRRIVAVVCVLAVAGMIVAAATHHLGAVIALGCVTVGSILALITAVAVSEPVTTEAVGVDARRARQVEEEVARLVAAGAEESAVRDLVGSAIRLGRGERAGGAHH